MSAFRAVNSTLATPDVAPARRAEDTTPTTPRSKVNFSQTTPNSQRPGDASSEDSSMQTPTRDSFGLSSQRPLPPADSIKVPSQNGANGTLGRMDSDRSHRSVQSIDSTVSQDVDMDREEEDHDGSDNESVTSDANRPSKKKKGQKFFCTDYPPCNLSFTRSEHLARHIRKHTGERPFQCHCSRRFSRLDNLRQHAQTVHVNEEIPGDSLAATSSRYQRQVRTDRVRQPGGRARSNTLGSQGPGPSRGHSRNLSTSSTISTSSIAMPSVQDFRRRPQPIVMAQDGTARANLTLNTMEAYNPPLIGSPGPQFVEYEHQQHHPGSTTPTSATFSTANGSPGQFGFTFPTPGSNASSRPVSWAGPATPDRRLSTSSTAGPGSARLPPLPFEATYNASASLNGHVHGPPSTHGSPAGSTYPERRRDSLSDYDSRRRTWHPGFAANAAARPATSGLGYYQTPDSPRPTFTSQPAATQTRLPGIDSFVRLLPGAGGTNMQPDSSPPRRPSTQYGPSEPQTGEKRKSISLSSETDVVQQRIHHLDIARENNGRESWGYAQQQRNSGHYGGRPVTAPHPSYMSQPSYAPSSQVGGAQQQGQQGQRPVTPRTDRRQAWYGGPLSASAHNTPGGPHQGGQGGPAQRTSPEDSSGSEGVATPLTNTVAEYHPAIVHSSGHVETRPPGAEHEMHKQVQQGSIMNRPHPLHQHQQYSSPQSHYTSSPPMMPPIRRAFGHQRGQSESALGMGFLGGMRRDTTRLDALVAVATSEQRSQAVAEGGR